MWGSGMTRALWCRRRPALRMQERKPAPSKLEWEEVSISGAEVSEISPSSDDPSAPEIAVEWGSTLNPPQLSPTRFSRASNKQPELMELEELSLDIDVKVSGGLPRVGDWIGDVYRLEGHLGDGAMGVVFSAVDEVLQRKVAIKLIRSTLQAADFRKRFMLEARAMALVSHPNVLTIHAFGEHESNPFIVMELVEGQTLDRWLARQGARHLALIGRRAPDDASALRDLAVLGAQAALHSCDAADATALAATLAKIRAVRPIGGVVHAAGILDDGAAIAMNEARFRRVLAPKLTAAENLDRLTEGDPLSLFLMFGSATTAFGNPGQANYVAANMALEALARRRRAQGRPALTVGWGPIADVGMLAEDRATAEKLNRRLGVTALEAEAALAALPALLAQPHASPLLLSLIHI